MLVQMSHANQLNKTEFVLITPEMPDVTSQMQRKYFGRFTAINEAIFCSLLWFLHQSPLVKLKLKVCGIN